jgi:hypothetical protein
MRLFHPGLLTAALLFAGSFAHADDAKDARTRKARAALALASTREVAPVPRAALLDYAAACTLATERHEPIITFVGNVPRKECPKGAVCAKTDKLPGYADRSVVIGYPVGDRILFSETLPENATDADLRLAYETALKQLKSASQPPQAPKLPTAHETDEWFITAEVDAEDVNPAPAPSVEPGRVEALKAIDSAPADFEFAPPPCPNGRCPACPSGECGPQGSFMVIPGGMVELGPMRTAAAYRAVGAALSFGRPHLFHGQFGDRLRHVGHRVFGRLRR